MDVGFIGLGHMGRAMARNIAKAGHRVRAWNRSAVGDAARDGIEILADPAEALQADVSFTMLSEDAAIRDVVLASGILESARAGLVHVVTSTISVEFAAELSARHAQAGVGYVSSPVFGRPDLAEKAQLGVVAAGKADAVAKARPLLEAIGRKVWVVGENPEQANAVKIAGNMMIAMAIETLAEAGALASSHGVKLADFYEVMLGTQFAGSRAYEGYSAKILNRDFEPGFKMRLGLKDLRLAEAASRGVGQRLPLLDALHARMAEAVEAGLGEKDWSAIAERSLPARDN